jgi:holin-like protein
MIEGLVVIFIFQSLGELFSHFIFSLIPGPVIGLVFLLIFLFIRGNVPASIDWVGSSILQHLGLLFIPATVGVVLYLPLLQTHAWGIALALLVSTIATVAVTSLFLKFMASADGEQNHHH